MTGVGLAGLSAATIAGQPAGRIPLLQPASAGLQAPRTLPPPIP
jgi:hypothetical protein